MCGVCGVWLRVVNPILLEVLGLVLGGVESCQPHTVGGFRVRIGGGLRVVNPILLEVLGLRFVGTRA